ncbi:MAG: hypothetical protein J1F09_07245 [Oscillospiraceae bacterium]|nr:hypothetical protein [Oscillospiraceae bacterium]
MIKAIEDYLAAFNGREGNTITTECTIYQGHSNVFSGSVDIRFTTDTGHGGSNVLTLYRAGTDNSPIGFEAFTTSFQNFSFSNNILTVSNITGGYVISIFTPA